MNDPWEAAPDPMASAGAVPALVPAAASPVAAPNATPIQQVDVTAPSLANAPMTSAGADAPDPWEQFSDAYNPTAPSAQGTGDEVLGFVDHMNHAIQRMNSINPVDKLATAIFPNLHQHEPNEGADAFVAQQEAAGKTPGLMGSVAGDALGSAPAMLLPGGPAVQGATSALITGNAATPKDIAADAAGGALGGFVGNRVMGALGSVVSPRIGPQVQTLIDAGVPLTPGQIAGGGLRRLEDGATSLPMLGDVINNSKRRAIEGFNAAAINRTLAPIGATLPADVEPGRASVDFAHQALSDAYTNLLPQLRVRADPQFFNDLTNTVQTTQGVLTPERSQQLQNIITSRVLPRIGWGGHMTGETMKDVDSQLGHLSRTFSRAPDPDQQAMGDALDGVQQNLRDLVTRGNPAQAPQLNAINGGWAQLKRVERAAGGVGARDGVFSAPQFSSAVKAADGNVGNYARGNAMMQDLSDGGTNVLPSSVPDSGSPYRHALEAFVALGVGRESKLLNIPTMLATGLPALAYSRAAQPAVQSAMTARPAWAPAVRGLLDTYARPPAAAFGGLLGGQGAQAGLPYFSGQ